MATIQIKNASQFLNRIKKNKQPFILEQTTFTKKIYYGADVFTQTEKGGVNQKELFLFKMVQRDCEKILVPNMKSEDISYVARGFKKEVQYTNDLHEIDLSSAYWEVARKKGYISEVTYKRGLEVSKQTRLMSLGSLATVKVYQTWDTEKFTSNIVPKKTAGIFFDIANEISSIMLRCSYLVKEQNYFFYWCDAIFFKGERERVRIESFLKSESVKFSHYNLDRIKIRGDTIEIDSLEHKKNNRKFQFKKSNTKITFHKWQQKKEDM